MFHFVCISLGVHEMSYISNAIEYAAGWKDKVENTPLIPISGFVLDKMFQRNASNFAIFYMYEKPKLLFPLFTSCYFILFSNLSNECSGLC